MYSKTFKKNYQLSAAFRFKRRCLFIEFALLYCLVLFVHVRCDDDDDGEGKQHVFLFKQFKLKQIL